MDGDDHARLQPEAQLGNGNHGWRDGLDRLPRRDRRPSRHGPGSTGFDEQYTGSCTSDATTGTVRVTIPTTAGVQHLAGTFSERRTALAIDVEVRFQGARYSGIGAVIPTQGTCLLSPLRQAAIVLTGSLRSAA